MSRKKTLKVITTIAVIISTVLAWLSGYAVMHIVYDSIVASIIFGTLWAVIVYCESRFSHISLKIDGRIEITKAEIKSNLLHIIAAAFVAVFVTIPLELCIYHNDIIGMVGDATNNLGLRLHALSDLFATNWLPMVLICVLVVAIYETPIFVRMASEE